MGAQPYYPEFFIYMDNFTYGQTYAGLATALGVLVFLPWVGLGGRPKFLARAAGMVPFFIVVHWTVTRMYEPRLFLPLLPVILPLAIMALFGETPGIVRAPAAPRMDPSPQPPASHHFAARSPAAAYALLFVAFVAVFAAFCAYNSKLHLAERTSRELINEASAANRAGDYAEAERLLLEACELDPENALARMSPGIVYMRQGHPARAEKEFRAALELDPHGPYAERIRGQLRALGSGAE